MYVHISPTAAEPDKMHHGKNVSSSPHAEKRAQTPSVKPILPAMVRALDAGPLHIARRARQEPCCPVSADVMKPTDLRANEDYG